MVNFCDDNMKNLYMEKFNLIIEDIQQAQVDCGGRFMRRDEISSMRVCDLLMLLIPNNVDFVVKYNNKKQINMISLKAEKGKFRVVAVDTFDNDDWIVGEFEDKNVAVKTATDSGGEMLKTYVYNDEGKCLFSAGSY